MRKITCLLVVAVVLLTACGRQSPVQSTDPTSTDPTWQEQYDLGMRYLSEGNYTEAIIAFTAAIEIDPKQAPSYVGRGQAYILSGETEENLTAAQADYEKAIELDETNPDAYLGLADVYVRRGDYEKALEILRGGFEKTNNDQTIADKIADIEEELALLHPASRFPEVLMLFDEWYIEISDDMEETLNRIISVGVSGNHGFLKGTIAEEAAAITKFIKDAGFPQLNGRFWGQLSNGALIILDKVNFYEEGWACWLEYRPVSGKGFVYYYSSYYHYYHGDMRDWLWNGAFEGFMVEADTNEIWRRYEGQAVDEFYDGEVITTIYDALNPSKIDLTRYQNFSKGEDLGWPEGEDKNRTGDGVPSIKDVETNGEVHYWNDLNDRLYTVGSVR